MRKIEFTEEQVQYYYKLINGFKRRKDYVTPLNSLKKLRSDKYSKISFENCFLTFLINNFQRIILLKPREIQCWIKLIDQFFSSKFHEIKKNEKGNMVFAQTGFGEDLIKTLRYDELQKSVLKIFFHKAQIKTCCYCNSQYTLTFEMNGKTSSKYQLDHIFPKSKYPYFSISLYNLVPSCANCNLNKSKSDFWMEDYFHPYNESFESSFKFTLSKKSDSSLFLDPDSIDWDDSSITITNKNDTKVEAHNSMFDIEGIYSNFGEIAKEIIELGRYFPQKKRDELLNTYKTTSGAKLFPTEESMDRLFLRVYPQKGKINERPLSKFIQDIARFSEFYDDKGREP